MDGKNKKIGKVSIFTWKFFQGKFLSKICPIYLDCEEFSEKSSLGK